MRAQIVPRGLKAGPTSFKLTALRAKSKHRVMYIPKSEIFKTLISTFNIATPFTVVPMFLT